MVYTTWSNEEMKAKPMDIEMIMDWLDYQPEEGTLTWCKPRVKNTEVGGLAGTVLTDGTIGVLIKHRIYPAHRIIYMLENLEAPMPHMVIHKDGNKLNNRITNLEACTRQEHMAKLTAKRIAARR